MRDILTDFYAAPHLSDPDPVRRAQIQMRSPLPKRFYQTVEIVQGEAGYCIALDGKFARTPAKAPIALPTHAAAELVAAEFDAQIDVVNPVTMPTMRLANTAIDGVAQATGAVRDDILRFAGSDLLCYRAGSPKGLVERQNDAWNPPIEWIGEWLGARFRMAEGIVYLAQPAETIARIAEYLNSCEDPLRLAALHLVTTLTGSAILAIALNSKAITGDEGWNAAHVDEDWQIAQWGQDTEAISRRSSRRRDFNAALAMILALDVADRSAQMPD